MCAYRDTDIRLTNYFMITNKRAKRQQKDQNHLRHLQCNFVWNWYPNEHRKYEHRAPNIISIYLMIQLHIPVIGGWRRKKTQNKKAIQPRASVLIARNEMILMAGDQRRKRNGEKSSKNRLVRNEQ